MTMLFHKELKSPYRAKQFPNFCLTRFPNVSRQADKQTNTHTNISLYRLSWPPVQLNKNCVRDCGIVVIFSCISSGAKHLKNGYYLSAI